MEDHIAMILNLRQKIIQAGGKVDDLQVAQALILSLPNTLSWEMVAVQLIHSEKITTDIVSTRLQAEANRCTHEKPGSQTALFTTGRRKVRGSKDGEGRGPKPDDGCRYCHAKGHWANKCPRCGSDENKPTTVATGKSANVAVGGVDDSTKREVGQVFMATEGHERPGIILDTSATTHMFCDRSHFRKYTPLSNETVSLGDK